MRCTRACKLDVLGLLKDLEGYETADPGIAVEKIALTFS